MKNAELTDSQKQAVDVLRRALGDLPMARLEAEQSEQASAIPGVDFFLRLDVAGSRQLLAVEVLRNGEPAVVRKALDLVFRLRVAVPEARFVLIAPYISDRAADLCVRQGVSYADLSGNCRLSFDPVFIRREGVPNGFATKRSLRTIYSPKASRVLRVMLVQPRRPWRLQVLADEAAVSLGQVAKVKSVLLDREWAVANPEGLKLTEPAAVLGEWIENIRYVRPLVRDFYSLDNIRDVEANLGQVCSTEGIRYALTSFSAAGRLAPQVRYQRATAYVEDDVDTVAQKLKLKEVLTGANVRLLVPRDEGVFYGTREIDGLSLVSPVQCYLDLQAERGRGTEAADTLMKEVLFPLWQTTQTSLKTP